jgi:hypothetical protein
MWINKDVTAEQIVPTNERSVTNIGQEFRPFDLSDPFPFYARAWTEEPIFYSPELEYWVTTPYKGDDN